MDLTRAAVINGQSSLLCPVHTAGATKLSSWVSSVGRAVWIGYEWDVLLSCTVLACGGDLMSLLLVVTTSLLVVTASDFDGAVVCPLDCDCDCVCDAGCCCCCCCLARSILRNLARLFWNHTYTCTQQSRDHGWLSDVMPLETKW